MLHENMDAIQAQYAELKSVADAVARQTKSLAQLAAATEDRWKEIGDVQNWAELVQRDLQVVQDTLDLAADK